MKFWRRKKKHANRLCNFPWGNVGDEEPTTFHKCTKNKHHLGDHQCKHLLASGKIVNYFYNKGERWTSPGT